MMAGDYAAAISRRSHPALSRRDRNVSERHGLDPIRQRVSPLEKDHEIPAFGAGISALCEPARHLDHPAATPERLAHAMSLRPRMLAPPGPSRLTSPEPRHE